MAEKEIIGTITCLESKRVFQLSWITTWDGTYKGYYESGVYLPADDINNIHINKVYHVQCHSKKINLMVMFTGVETYLSEDGPSTKWFVFETIDPLRACEIVELKGDRNAPK